MLVYDYRYNCRSRMALLLLQKMLQRPPAVAEKATVSVSRRMNVGVRHVTETLRSVNLLIDDGRPH